MAAVFHYVNALLHGDLGTSIRTGRPVLEDLKTFSRPRSNWLSAPCLSRWWSAFRWGAFGGVSQPLDRSPGSPDGADRNLYPGVLAGAGSDCPVLRQTGLVAQRGRLDDWFDPPTRVTGFYLIDSLLEGNIDVFFNALQHLILPATTLAFVHRDCRPANSLRDAGAAE